MSPKLCPARSAWAQMALVLPERAASAEAATDGSTGAGAPPTAGAEPPVAGAGPVASPPEQPAARNGRTKRAARRRIGLGLLGGRGIDPARVADFDAGERDAVKFL